MKILFWNNLSTKDRVINILCVFFTILMFMINKLFFYIIFGYVILMFIIKYSIYFNEIDRLKFEIKNKEKSNSKNQGK